MIGIDPSGLETHRGGDFFQYISQIVRKNPNISDKISEWDFCSYMQSNGTVVWYTSVDCWQRLFGYSNIYDTGADL